MGRMWGRVWCCMCAVKNIKDCWGGPLWDDQLLVVGCRDVFLSVPALVKFLWQILWYWPRCIVLTDVPGSTLMWRGLLP